MRPGSARFGYGGASVALADLDGDGHLDLVGRRLRQLRQRHVFLNDGSGAFTLSRRHLRAVYPVICKDRGGDSTATAISTSSSKGFPGA